MVTSLKDNRILEKMLERLFAALVSGPSLNARPHSSRQRIDFMQLGRLKDRSLEEILRELLGEQREAKVVARVPMFKRTPRAAADPSATPAEEPPLTDEEKQAQQAYADQQSVLNKCRSIAEDARTYENDTGVHVLQIGFPLLSLPPGTLGAKGGVTRRILAPVALISLSMTVKSGPNPSVTLECRNEGADLVLPNVALLAWLEAQAGRNIEELDKDEHGERPWDEIAQVVGRVAHLLDQSVPAGFASGEELETNLALRSCPRADDLEARPEILSSAVIGLFPLANEGLIRDTQAILAGEPVSGPIESFVNVAASLQPAEAPQQTASAPAARVPRDPADERLISAADPCQNRAVKLARQSRGLVVHGPPGTGKSQTIANIIGDHLSRSERVLFVCDKRTALDVVMNRLESMGLGGLCAVVHDPQRDQRDLYRAIRDQLDNLAELRTNGDAPRQLERLDQELKKLHDQLTEYHQALMARPDPATQSFHSLIGQWFELPSHDVAFKEALVAGVSPEQLEACTQPLHELLERGVACEYAANPWSEAGGMPLADFLATPMDEIRERLQSCRQAGQALDATLHEDIPPFTEGEDVMAAAADRAALAERLKRPSLDLTRLRKWAAADAAVTANHGRALTELAPHLELIEQGPLDRELCSAVRGALPSIAAINGQIVALEHYLRSASSFLGFLFVGRKKAAAQALGAYALPLSPENATRARDFLLRLKARLLLRDAIEQLGEPAAGGGLIADEELVKAFRLHEEVLTTLRTMDASPHLQPLRERVAAAAVSPELPGRLIDGLDRSMSRAQAIEAFEKSSASSGLFAHAWSGKARSHIRSGKPIVEHLGCLSEKLATLENVLRVREGLTGLPDALRVSMTHLLSESVWPEVGLAVLRKSVLGHAIGARLRSDPRLQSADRHKLQSSFERYLALESDKRTATRELILDLWGSRQRARLLASTGSRLNSAGADVRRRFMLRGERAMRLRQVIAIGQGQSDGDPLLDLRPVWMASPETVAQIFPRQPLFDVIVFDEASQCRLEEALPVLLRGQRVVIAGDPKQLPPTRFFESAIAVSDEEEIESDQQLFETQQGEIEDLLGAALNIEIEECYLDVHYRSRNSDLIEFSNGHFYGSRLQPIPGHPANRTRYAPLTLYRVDGVYRDRCNEAEAEQVSQIVRDLLRRAEPPSIGIACFNITQRDLILEKLDELAEADSASGRALAEARKRRGRGQFEGLFVKNLENVQGDERDHMIISTTYGPDPSGRFYRRFGPLGRAGGGRRLNVLVTRARDEVHLVTSIPASEYRHLPPIPPGQTAGGPWLLFSYLAYAEHLAALYEEQHRVLSQTRPALEPTLTVRPTRFASDFCRSLGRHLLEGQRIGSEVYWGNDGFCVDLALQHPRRLEDVTLGVLCDMTRFEQASDPVEWEVFRSVVLQSQGWNLHRLWTPHFFRDPRGSLQAIRKEMEEFLAAEKEKDAIPVEGNEGPSR